MIHPARMGEGTKFFGSAAGLIEASIVILIPNRTWRESRRHACNLIVSYSSKCSLRMEKVAMGRREFSTTKPAPGLPFRGKLGAGEHAFVCFTKYAAREIPLNNGLAGK